MLIASFDTEHVYTDERTMFSVQSVILTRQCLSPELYWRAEGIVQEQDCGLYISPGASVDFTAYANVFFEWHWLRHTGVTAEMLEIEIIGSGIISIKRTADDVAIEVASQEIADGETRVRIPVASGLSGLLSCSIAARDTNGLFIRRCEWLVPSQPKPVSIDVAVCTFNKIDMLSRSLEVMCALAPMEPCLGRIVLVDQGSEKLAKSCAIGTATVEAIASGRLLIVDQPNLGGSGGFTRAILEALGDGNCTHVLLMDDDILFEPRLIARLASFLGLLPKDAVVGGSMFDMVRPSHMFAYSERFNTRTAHCERLQPCDLDLSAAENLKLLEHASKGNYNGWFICCFPRSAFEEHGLPLPLFVRSDDCEFGLRLTSNDYPLVHMPGLFVWHEPFWLKQRSWIEYYTLRNHLIVASFAADCRLERLALRRLSECWHHISTFQYAIAFASCLALEDFLEGPHVVFNNVVERHARVTGQVAAFERNMFQGQGIERGKSCPARGGPARTRFHPLVPTPLKWLSNAIWTLFGQPPAPGTLQANQAVGQDKLWWGVFYRHRVVLCDTVDGRTSIALVHDAMHARRLTLRIMKAALRLIWSSRRLRREYNRAARYYSSPTYWKTLFAEV